MKLYCYRSQSAGYDDVFVCAETAEQAAAAANKERAENAALPKGRRPIYNFPEEGYFAKDFTVFEPGEAVVVRIMG